MGRSQKLAQVAADKDTGALAGNGPTFSAYKNATQSITANVNTKVTFQVEEWDTASCYDTSTSRFTPNVAGYYLIATGVSMGNYTNRYTAKLYKNGSAYKVLQNNTGNGTNDDGVFGSAIVYLNGSTDYVEMYVEGNNTATVQSGADQAWFQGCLVARV